MLAHVAEAIADCGLDDDALERIKTASAEAAMNAIEHGNHNRAELPVEVSVLRTRSAESPSRSATSVVAGRTP